LIQRCPQRGMENKGIHILLLVEISFPLTKAI
jgi:hypothetical protein